MNQFYLGIDLHLKRTYAVLMDSQGQVLDERRLPNEEMAAYLKKEVPPETYAVLEATRNWPFMYDLLAEHVQRVELAHPKELKAISAAAVKTDKVDARTLANLARMNYLPISYAAPSEIRDLRMEVRHRDSLVSQRTQAKNRIHAVLAGYNLVSPVTDLFSVSGREYLEEVMQDPLRSAAVRSVRRDLALIDHLTQQINEHLNVLDCFLIGGTVRNDHAPIGAVRSAVPRKAHPKLGGGHATTSKESIWMQVRGLPL